MTILSPMYREMSPGSDVMTESLLGKADPRSPTCSKPPYLSARMSTIPRARAFRVLTEAFSFHSTSTALPSTVSVRVPPASVSECLNDLSPPSSHASAKTSAAAAARDTIATTMMTLFTMAERLHR